MNAKARALLEHIKRLEERIAKGQEYLASGEHAHWAKFRPLFVHKLRDGNELPPHPDWVKNVFIPRAERQLDWAEKALERVTQRL